MFNNDGGVSKPSNLLEQHRHVVGTSLFNQQKISNSFLLRSRVSRRVNKDVLAWSDAACQ